jgi:ABC-2 type transport system ATP-binding protein
MIQVDNVTKFFGPVLAVDHVTFNISEGEIVGFLGPNGAGKTTTIRILTSFLPATYGAATIAGHDVMTDSIAARRHIGYLPESVPLYPEMRVEEYLAYRAKLKGVPRRDRPARIEYCLERCRVREVRRRLIGTLSKGYRQRVGLADALIHDPKILILDEPTVGLDPLQIRETLALIRELGRTHTVLLSTHILSEVEAICRRVIIIHSGRIGLDRELSKLELDAATVIVEARGPADEMAKTLRKVPGVTDLAHTALNDGIARLEIRAEPGQDPRERVAQAIAEHRWGLLRLDLRRRTLEDLFVDVVVKRAPPDTKSQTEGSAPAAAAG